MNIPTEQQQVQRHASKRPRVTKACRTCRKRKTCCSGDHPCKRCGQEGIYCDYNVVDGRTTRKQKTQKEAPPVDASVTSVETPNTTDWASAASSSLPVGPPGAQQQFTEASGFMNSSSDILRKSLEPGIIYEYHEQHTGPASGLAFLQEAVHRIEQTHESPRLFNVERPAVASASIFTSGDMPTISSIPMRLEMPSQEQSDKMLSRYFDFATPTYRFFHRPSVERWATEIIHGSSVESQQDIKNLILAPAKQAAVFLIWAQALEYNDAKSPETTTSKPFYEKARFLIDNEPGPPRLESVQARLGLCLYLLSTSRTNECWYSFGVTAFIVIALGLHRKRFIDSPSVGLIQSECQKRVFWSAYILDRYLSVMNGRPRIFRDEDIDQAFPANVSDSDMVYSDPEMLKALPTHGLMEATISHAKLTSIMCRATDSLYPLQLPPETDLIKRAEAVVEQLNVWEADLPMFLRPSEKTLTGQRIFERQNTVLKLSLAHVRILVNRIFVLENFATLGQFNGLEDGNSVSRRRLDDCLEATFTIIDTVDAFVSSQSLIRGFWFTQYIALCAISTLYIYIIHHHIDASTLMDATGKNIFTSAQRCQKYLSIMAPEGSPSRRYHVLLAHLRSKARHASLMVGVGETSRNAQDVNWLAANGGQRQEDQHGQGMQPNQMELTGSLASDLHGLGGYDDQGTMGTMGSMTDSECIVDFDTIPLSWKYLDQLALPNAYDIFGAQQY